MSGTMEDLVLLIMFDEVENGRVPDGSNNAYDGTLQGSPVLVPDDMFGSCLSFAQDGDFVSLPSMEVDLSKGLTIEAWAFYSAFENGARIIDFSGIPGAASIVLANEETTGNLVVEVVSGGTASTMKAESVLATGEWLHLAATVDKGGSATLYVNGQVKQSAANISLPSTGAFTSNYVGKSNAEGHGYFKGKIASLRLYNRALAADEIAKDMEADKAASASFRLSYPISFSLYSENDQQALYITDNPQGMPLNLELENTSQYGIQLASAETLEASSENYHFQLSFRPGTLLNPEAIGLKESGWSLKTGSSGAGDSLYLLSKEARDLKPGEKIGLTLLQVRANGSGGAHGTRVRLTYQQVSYLGDTVALTGSRVQHLSVINHSGEIALSLHAGFEGSQLVLNDGESSNNLTLIIYNTSTKDAIAWNPGEGDTSSKFIFSFDVQQANAKPKPWALGTTDDLIGTVISADGWTHKEEGQGISPEWILTHPDKSSIGPGEVIEFEISDVKSSLPSGQTNLYLRYKNIPGYRDGLIVRMLEKSPLQYVDKRVGIGTSTPRTELDLGAGIMSGAANDYQQAQFALSGGGTVTWGGPENRLGWSERFIAISMERGKTFSDGHIEINQPTTEIPGSQVYDGNPRVPNDDGIILKSMEALYAEHTVGGSKTDLSFHIVHWGSGKEFYAPSNWILVAVVNGDDGTVKLGTGKIISAKSASSKSDGVPCGTIVMWYGDFDSIPGGWALCDGNNGTPNLMDKFIVAAGNNYKPGDEGGKDSLKLTVDQMPQHTHTGTTKTAGAHNHRYALDTGSGGDDSNAYMPTGGNNLRNRWIYTEGAGDHSHTLDIADAGSGAEFDNRPAYKALCFIMKVF